MNIRKPFNNSQLEFQGTKGYNPILKDHGKDNFSNIYKKLRLKSGQFLVSETIKEYKYGKQRNEKQSKH